MNNEMRTGQVLLLTGMALLLTPTLLILVLQVLGSNSVHIPTVIRLVLTIGLLVGVYNGSNACRMILAVLLCLGVIMGIFTVMGAGIATLLGAIVLAVVLVQATFLVLMFIPPVDAFITARG